MLNKIKIIRMTITVLLFFMVPSIFSANATPSYQSEFELAHSGDAHAQFKLGLKYEEQQDFHEAINWFHKSAEQGNVHAQLRLGLYYSTGKGVLIDHSQSVKWYREAANKGNPTAQHNLGNAYIQGEGVDKDVSEAIKWFKLSAEQGFAPAQYNLALTYNKGNEVIKKDYMQAEKWYKLAAEQGFIEAQVNLGILYAQGDGINRDLLKAYMWLLLAQDNSDRSEIAESIRKLTEEMSVEQVSKAKKLAEQLRPIIANNNWKKNIVKRGGN